MVSIYIMSKRWTIDEINILIEQYLNENNTHFTDLLQYLPARTEGAILAQIQKTIKDNNILRRNSSFMLTDHPLFKNNQPATNVHMTESRGKKMWRGFELIKLAKQLSSCSVFKNIVIDGRTHAACLYQIRNLQNSKFLTDGEREAVAKAIENNKKAVRKAAAREAAAREADTREADTREALSYAKKYPSEAKKNAKEAIRKIMTIREAADIIETANPQRKRKQEADSGHNKKWSKSNMNILIECRERGESIQEMYDKFPLRTKNFIQNKIYEIDSIFLNEKMYKIFDMHGLGNAAPSNQAPDNQDPDNQAPDDQAPNGLV